MRYMLLLLPGSDRAQLNDAVTVLALLMGLYVLLNLDTFVNVANIQELRILHIEVLQDVCPLQTGEGWLRLRLVGDHHV